MINSCKGSAVANIFKGLGSLKACVVPSIRSIMALPYQYGDGIIEGTGRKRADEHNNGRYKAVLTNTAVITTESASV